MSLSETALESTMAAAIGRSGNLLLLLVSLV
jgi:hypothetical protein